MWTPPRQGKHLSPGIHSKDLAGDPDDIGDCEHPKISLLTSGGHKLTGAPQQDWDMELTHDRSGPHLHASADLHCFCTTKKPVRVGAGPCLQGCDRMGLVTVFSETGPEHSR